MAESWKNRVVLAKTETTYGEDPTPTGAANAMLLHNVSITPMAGESIKRDLIGRGQGAQPAILVGTHVTLEAEVELAGSGTAGTAPAWGTLLRGCGMGETVNAGVDVVYKPISTAQESLTLYFYLEDALHAITGARGTWSLELSPKKIPYIKFSFTGLFVDPASDTFPTPDFSDFQKPLYGSTANTPTFTLAGYTPVISAFTYSHNNEVIFRELINSTGVEIVNRSGEGNLTIEAPDIATKDYFALAQAETQGVLQIIHGTAAGNTIQIDAPTVQMMRPNYQDDQNVAMLQMGLSFIPTDAGDDEIQLTVK